MTTSYTFGLLLPPLMAALSLGRTSLSAVGSLQVAVYSVTGVAAARLVTRCRTAVCCHHSKAELVSRFGTRPVCVAGAVVAASGLLAASFSSSLAWLLATYSCVTGVGFGQYHVVTVG